MKQKVLFIGIGFYDYENAIVSEFHKLNYEVDYFSEVPKVNLKYKFLSKIKNKRYLNKINILNSNNIAEKCGFDYNLIFVIKGAYLTNEALTKIRGKNPKAKYVLYLWDSLIRFESVKNKFSFFDHVYSFDRLDCLNDTNITFNPLFYRAEYDRKQFPQIDKTKSVDVYHLGWYHSDRLELLNKVNTFLTQNSLKSRFLLYTGYPNYILQKLFGGELRGAKKYLIFKPVSAEGNFKNILESKTTLDIAHPMQSGLTIRTIELLCSQKKIITTNNDIANYDFYNSNNIMIIDRDNPILNLDFFNSDFVPVDNRIIEKYSITNWLKRMI